MQNSTVRDNKNCEKMVNDACDASWYSNLLMKSQHQWNREIDGKMPHTFTRYT